MSRELPITGYLDRLSRRPGERVTAHVSVREGGAARARLVRVACADPNPAGPGMRILPMPEVFDAAFGGIRQPIALGSYGVVERGPAHDGARSWTVLVWAAQYGAPAAVLAEQRGPHAVSLRVAATGAEAELVWPGGRARVASGVRLRPRAWHRLWLSADPATGTLVLGQDETVARAACPGLSLPAGARITMAAEGVPARAHFTGKLEAPALRAGLAATAAEAAGLPALAVWDFARDIASFAIADAGPHGLHGTLVNGPLRGVKGAHWTGREQCWRHAPEDYAAIHFHEDDIEDCNWSPSLHFDVPETLPSGAYALHLTCADGEDFLPFYVLPQRAGPFARVAVLGSTFTFQAYANHARGNADEAYMARVAAWGAYPANPDHFPLYGRSTYNKHADGAGIAFSTRRRPMLTMRPGFLTFDDSRGSGLRHYPADTHLLAWLEAKGIAFDIITDEDLDDEGPSLLAPYRCVLTGSHPEYHTPGTLDALLHYRDHGGNFAYLGGNGFYWRIARDKARPHLIELRRAEGGIRAWAAEPGEYYHMLDGGYGGLWRRNSRPPQLLAGVGFSGQGRFEGTYYRRLPASYEPRFAWMFDGIAAEKLGDYGLSGGGAAGFELDRADFALGTPEETVILARSEDPPASFVTVPEELLSHISTVTGEDPDALKRGEIVWFNTPSGGAVFAVGSITFCGSLWRGGRGEGDISRLLENVVRRFAGL